MKDAKFKCCGESRQKRKVTRVGIHRGLYKIHLKDSGCKRERIEGKVYASVSLKEVLLVCLDCDLDGGAPHRQKVKNSRWLDKARL